MLNAVGLQNVGVRAFIAEKLPFLRQFNVTVIANIFGETIDEYRRVTEILTRAAGVHAIEVNISCPNVKRGRRLRRLSGCRRRRHGSGPG